MATPKNILKASLDASMAFWRPPGLASFQKGMLNGKRTVVPIRSLSAAHAGRITAHLLALSPADRYLRFGYAANDEQISHYARGLDFSRDEIFGIYNRRLELIAVAHLAFSSDPQLHNCAEFGVSVLAKARGRGYGARLFDRAVMHSRNNGVEVIFIHALSENTAMLNIVRKAGAKIERDGSESEAYLKLLPADLDSRMAEIFDEQIADTDYRLKVQAKQFRDVLEIMQDVRRGIRASRERTSM